MELTPDRDRELDFTALLSELQGLMGERVTVEAAPGGHPVVLTARGTLTHTSDFQLVFGRPLDAPSVLCFTLDHSGAWFSVREAEVVSARAFTIDAIDGFGAARHVQILMRGGLELIVGVDRLAELFDG
jgi:hypothetical protein